jgi:hypothetical protein
MSALEKQFEQIVQEAFAAPFFTGTTLNADLHAQTPVNLAMGLLAQGMHYEQVNALALSVREVCQLEAPEQTSPLALSAKQKAAWTALLGEKALPETFRTVLEAASARVLARRDLTVLYGLLAGTLEKINVLQNMAQLSDPPATETQRP